jgi:hypothetical protein
VVVIRIAAVLTSCAACAGSPAQVSWHDIELGHHTCGPSAEIELTLDRSCTLVVRENRAPLRSVAVDRKRCNEVLEMAAHRHSKTDCSEPQPFIAYVDITMESGSVAHACWNDPLAARFSALADELAPSWRRGAGMPTDCSVRAAYSRPAPPTQ